MPLDTHRRAKKQQEKHYLRHQKHLQTLASSDSLKNRQEGLAPLKVKTPNWFQLLVLAQAAFALLFIGYFNARRTPLQNKSDSALPLNNRSSSTDLIKKPINSRELSSKTSNRPTLIPAINSKSNQQESNLKKTHKKMGELRFFSRKQEKNSVHNPLPIESKDKNIEKIARQVCHDVHEKKYHLYNNPPGTHFETKDRSFTLPESDNAYIRQNIIRNLRHSADYVVKRAWPRLKIQIDAMIQPFDLSEEAEHLVQSYILNLNILHNLTSVRHC